MAELNPKPIEDFWPLLIEIYRGVATPEESQAHRDKIMEQLGRGERYGTIADMRHAGISPYAERKKHSAQLKANTELLKKISIGVAMVMSSSVMRVSVNAVLFMSPLPMPYTVVSTIEEAQAWMRERFEEEGLPFPEGADQYLKKLADTKAA